MTFVQDRSDPGYAEDVLAVVSGDRCFDIGANGGATARTFAPNFTEVVAFEPAAESYQFLCSELPANVIPVNVAVSDVSGEVELEERPGALTMGELTSPAGIAESAGWGAVTDTRLVRSRTLPELAGEYGDPDFVKIDTEGHEQRVVAGGLEYLRDMRPRMVIEVHDRDQGEWIIRELGAPLQLHRHPYYAPGSPSFLHHYWLMYGI